MEKRMIGLTFGEICAVISLSLVMFGMFMKSNYNNNAMTTAFNIKITEVQMKCKELENNHINYVMENRSSHSKIETKIDYLIDLQIKKNK